MAYDSGFSEQRGDHGERVRHRRSAAGRQPGEVHEHGMAVTSQTSLWSGVEGRQDDGREGGRQVLRTLIHIN
jgi:hypothetical protein